jgi:transposase InsO family protein
VNEEFSRSGNNYGSRKLKVAIEREYGLVLSLRKIRVFMKEANLVSNYMVHRKKSKPQSSGVNQSLTGNVLNRQFSGHQAMEVICSDVTYVTIGGAWHYLCPMLDLGNRRIVGGALSKSRDSKLTKQAFYSISCDLRKIRLFHTDRGKEFTGEEIDKILKAFQIERSLSNKGEPIDNSALESLNHIIKTEFTKNHVFSNMREFEEMWHKYVNWYNNERLHSSLNYLPPATYAETRKQAHIA